MNPLWTELVALRQQGEQPVECYCAICDEFRPCMRCPRKGRSLYVCVECAANGPPDWWPQN